MMNVQVFNETISIIMEVLQKHHKEFGREIQGNVLLKDDLGLDSIDLVILQVELEDKFRIRFEPLEDNFSKIFYSIKTLCDCLEKKIGENNGYQ